jgi:hypothetical protein
VLKLEGDIGGAIIPTGSTAQRPTTALPVFRFNETLGQYEAYYPGESAWAGVGGGAVGGSSDEIFYENDIHVTTDYTITVGKNAMSAGEIIVDNGVTVTIPTGSNWSIV